MRLIGRIFKWVGVAFAILILVGVGYQAIASWRDQRLTPPLSEMVNVGGKRIHVVCVGTGPRSFLLDAGLGAWSSEWTRLQPLLAKQGRVCAVDRSGVGWSEDLGGRHDGASVADELAAIVVAARVNLVGPGKNTQHGIRIAYVNDEKHATSITRTWRFAFGI